MEIHIPDELVAQVSNKYFGFYWLAILIVLLVLFVQTAAGTGASLMLKSEILRHPVRYRVRHHGRHQKEDY